MDPSSSSCTQRSWGPVKTMGQMVLFPDTAQHSGRMTDLRVHKYLSHWEMDHSQKKALGQMRFAENPAEHITHHTFPGYALRDTCLIIIIKTELRRLLRHLSVLHQRDLQHSWLSYRHRNWSQKQWNELLGIILETWKPKHISWLSREAFNSRLLPNKLDFSTLHFC